jgi:hypothetical protein
LGGLVSGQPFQGFLTVPEGHTLNGRFQATFLHDSPSLDKGVMPGISRLFRLAILQTADLFITITNTNPMYISREKTPGYSKMKLNALTNYRNRNTKPDY